MPPRRPISFAADLHAVTVVTIECVTKRSGHNRVSEKIFVTIARVKKIKTVVKIVVTKISCHNLVCLTQGFPFITPVR